MRHTRICLTLLAAAACCATADTGQDKSAEMIPVKYDRLKAEVLKQRGKVVIVDFWAGY